MKASIIVEKYNIKNNNINLSQENLINLSQEELIKIILSLKTNLKSLSINDLIINLLLDDDYLDASNSDIADAVRLIAGSDTTAKSVSSVRSVYNKSVLDAHMAAAPAMDAREKAIYKAALEFDLIENKKLIKSRN